MNRSQFIGILVLPLFFITPLISHAATTTIKIYPTDDGTLELYDSENQTSWSSARSYTGSFANGPFTNIDLTAQKADKYGTAGQYRIYRSTTHFDTSAIPDDASIVSASMFAYAGDASNSGSPDHQLVLTEHTRASSTAITKADWYLSNYGPELSRGSLLDGQYVEFPFNATGTAYINPEGYTDIGGMQDNDYDNVDVGTARTDVAFFSSDASGTSTDPYLEVTYVTPTTIKIYPTDDGTLELYDSENQTSWSSARSYTGSFANGPFTNIDLTAQKADKYGTAGQYRIYRSTTHFDTSAIPDDASIVSASMFAYAGDASNSGSPDHQLVLTEHTRASSTAITKADWYLSNYGPELSRGSLLDGQYVEFPFNATGTAYINPEGYTDIGGMQDNDYDNVDVGTARTDVAFFSSDASGTSTDPYLEVTYY